MGKRSCCQALERTSQETGTGSPPRGSLKGTQVGQELPLKQIVCAPRAVVPPGLDLARDPMSR